MPCVMLLIINQFALVHLDSQEILSLNATDVSFSFGLVLVRQQNSRKYSSFSVSNIFIYFTVRGCLAYLNCPGNLQCLPDGTCGCPPEFRRRRDYCIQTSYNCTTTDPCDKNQECIYIGPPPGFCVCPHGYELINGDCIG